MQVTIDLPENLARALESERQRVGRIIARGLRPETAALSSFRHEVISFLAQGPRPTEIIAFQPSEAAVARIRELRDRNQEGSLSAEEEAEMDEVAEVDNLVSMLKAEARLHLGHSA